MTPMTVIGKSKNSLIDKGASTDALFLRVPLRTQFPRANVGLGNWVERWDDFGLLVVVVVVLLGGLSLFLLLLLLLQTAPLVALLGRIGATST
jgi:hypothetical protein